MREQPTGTLVLDYILKHKEKHGSYPSGYKVAKDLEIGMSTAKYYIQKMRSEGIIPECECRMRDRPGEDAVYDYIQQYCAVHGTNPTEKEIERHTGQARSTVRSHIARMLREKRIENKDGIYAEPGEDYEMSKRDLIDAGMTDERIWEYEFDPANVELIPEPENPHDPNAVKVIVDGEHVGYVKKGSCKHILKLIAENRILRIDCEIGGGNYKIVSEEYDDEKDKEVYTLVRDKTNFFVTLTIREKE